MAQLFSRKASAAFRLGIVLVLLGVFGASVALYAWSRSGKAWDIGKPAEQPIPFHHSLHAGALGIDCRYCHSSAERAAFAGMPSASTCMTCHAEIWPGAGVLEPLRTSLALNQPIVWRSVHRLPDHVYFHHGIHVSKGVGCATCHGNVETMTETVKTETLSMGWCLDCHRHPAGKASHGSGRDGLTDCSACHR